MPDGILTLLDIAKINGSDMLVGLVDEAARIVPEMTGVDGRGNRVPNMGSGRTINGISYEVLVNTGLPAIGFRNANEGTDLTKSTQERRIVECFSLTPRWAVDRVVADRSQEGVAALMARQANAHFKAAMMHCGSQFYYGISNDAKGFAGLLAQYNSAAMTVDATGTTPATGSSVWGVKFGAEYVQWVYGNNGRFEIPDMRIQDMADNATPAKYFSAYLQEMFAHIGLQLMNKYSVGRIKDLTAETGKKLTDDLMFELMSKAPAGYMFDVFFMSRRSLEQLRQARTATNTTGYPAQTPTEVAGIPIVVTDSITDTETLT